LSPRPASRWRTLRITPSEALGLVETAQHEPIPADARPGEEPWINPIGGLGDTLMLSGVLKQLVERYPGRRFRLVRRPGYMSILAGHPAISGVGFPPPGVEVHSTDYWNREPLGSGRQRPMQILGRMFGLEEPVEERFYVHEDGQDDLLLDMIPWGAANIVIAPGSASPRKEWSHENWAALCRRLRAADFFVIQVGEARQRHVRLAYSLLGLTEPRQIFGVLRRADLIVTVDNFLMHAAHHLNLPAVVLWGPTEPEVYGYPEQCHLSSRNSCPKPDGCIGPSTGNNYGVPCPLPATHCVDQIRPGEVLRAVERVVAAKLSSAHRAGLENGHQQPAGGSGADSP
jgi:ADP-heptose:LPS heptosyltransferase